MLGYVFLMCFLCYFGIDVWLCSEIVCASFVFVCIGPVVYCVLVLCVYFGFVCFVAGVFRSCLVCCVVCVLCLLWSVCVFVCVLCSYGCLCLCSMFASHLIARRCLLCLCFDSVVFCVLCLCRYYLYGVDVCVCFICYLLF